MDNIQINNAIAHSLGYIRGGALGYTHQQAYVWYKPDESGNNQAVNNARIGEWFSWADVHFTTDLNLMHMAVETLRGKDGLEWFDFQVHLTRIAGSSNNAINADARLRAKAYLLTIGILKS